MKSKADQNSLRIIGGRWRSRTFSFPNIPEVRPTPNRVRETLFNWLSPVIVGARCLDLFAGSGALGFEALSRGASALTLIDHHSAVIAHLNNTIAVLKAENTDVFCLEIPLSPIAVKKPFDIVFLDPPFFQGLIGPCCEWLEKEGLLAEDAYLYIEAEKTLSPLPVPVSWKLLKHKVAGQVGYHLFKV